MNAATLDVVAIDWERVQLVIRLRGTFKTSPGPTGLGLTRTRWWSRETMPPTSERYTGDEVAVRFDVMQGPARRPMSAGTWALTAARTETSGPAHLSLAPSLTATGRTFQLPHCRYDTAVSTNDVCGTVALRILIDPFGGRVPRRWPRWRMGRGALDAVRIACQGAIRRLFVATARSTTRRTGRRVVFASAAGHGLGGNLKAVHDRMVERGLGVSHRLVVLHTSSATGRVHRWRERWRSARILLGADAILVAGSRNRAVYGLTYDADVRFVQLWHASGAFKTVGFSRAGRPDGPDPYALVHRSYTFAIVSSSHDVPFYAEAFGIPESRFVPSGIPRMDRYFDEDARAAGREAAITAFPSVRGHAVWLFAPTYRGTARAATYDYDRIDFARLYGLAAARDAVVIIKMHPFVTQPVPIPGAMTDRLIDGTRASVDVNDLLFAVDLLITDYSSIVFEFSTLDRPMLFFAYDLDEYIAERDFYVPFEEFVPGRIVRTFDALLDAIRREDYDVEKVPEFARRHFDHLDGTSTDRVIDELVIAR